MSWDAKDVALLKELWAAGHSAGQIASRLGHSRNAVSAKLKRMGHKRGHKPPTANPKIVAGRARSRTGAPGGRGQGVQAEQGYDEARRGADQNTKRELYAMLANAVRNTG
jgi:GcrA cell cycle regulator